MVILLAAVLACADTVSVFAKDSQAPDPAVVAAQVRKFGVGKAVKVKLIGGEKLNGHIQSIGADTFTITVSKAGGERAIPYNQVVEVKDPGPLFWILVGAALVIVIIVAAKH
jgi:sRNA-binding regulator protein Hfq